MRCLIVDDERLAREDLRLLLSLHGGVEIVGEAGRVKDALELTARLRPGVIFLDVQMQGESGFDFIAQCPAPRPQIILVTAHDTHAVRGFECNALDYLLKPVNPGRLAEAIERARRQAPVRSVATIDDMVLLRIGPTARFVPWRCVQRVATEGDYTRVFLDDGVEGLVLRPLKQWIELAPAGLLVRLHRRSLVRADAIREIRLVAKDRREAVLASGVSVPIGREFWPAVKELVSRGSSA
jgi:two-component system LytT family response regulator